MWLRANLVKILSVIGLKESIRGIVFFMTNLFNRIFNLFFNEVVRSQNNDHTQIPIIIISFNQYSFLKELVDYLLKINHNKIIIIDNNSTYKPLLSYLDSLNDIKITIYRLNENYGHMVFWKNESIFKKYSSGYYIISDPDIIPLKECPYDFIKLLKEELDSNLNVNKVGLSLKIDDLPDSNFNKAKIISWEKQFWEINDTKGNFLANIDTTFAIYRPKSKNLDSYFYKALRMKYPYQARHKSWYIDNHNLSLEMKFLYQNASNSSSWRLNEEGNIIKSIYK